MTGTHNRNCSVLVHGHLCNLLLCRCASCLLVSCFFFLVGRRRNTAVLSHAVPQVVCCPLPRIYAGVAPLPPSKGAFTPLLLGWGVAYHPECRPPPPALIVILHLSMCLEGGKRIMASCHVSCFMKQIAQVHAHSNPYSEVREKGRVWET